MEETKPKFNWQRFAITVSVVVFTTVLVGAGVWYVMDTQAEEDKEVYENHLQELEQKYQQVLERLDGKSTTADSKIDDTATWKTFKGNGFSIKYPANWVYKDYSKLTEGADLIGFAPDINRLAPEQSDASSTVNVRWGDEAINKSEMTSTPNKLTSETLKISGMNVNKYTLLPGRPNDFGGDSKWVYYEFKLSSGKYLVITNVDDEEKQIFEQMVQTLSE